MTQRLRTAGLAIGLALALLGIGAAPAAAEAGDASAAAAEASLTGTIGIFPVNLLDLSLSEVAVSQGDEDQEATETLLGINLPIIGDVALVDAAAVSSTASSNHERAQASSFLTDVAVNLPVGALGTVLTLDAIGSTATCHIVEVPAAAVMPPVEATLLGVPVDIDLNEDIVVDIGIAQATLRLEEIEITTDTATAIAAELSLDVNILGVATLDLDVILARSACERGVAELPLATGIDPPSGPEIGGTVVTVTGDKFVPGYTSLTIGGITVPAEEVEVIDYTTLEFTTPAHEPGVVDVTVETPGGVSTPPLAFEYVPVGPGQPVALTIDPDSGPEAGGTVVTITGANFVVDETSVNIGGLTVPANEVNVVSETELQFTTPAHAAGVVDVTVETVSGGESDPPLAFTYLAQPVASTIDPASGPETGGTEVCISGENFVPGETIVHIGTETVPANEVEVNVDGTMACFVTPPHEPGVVDVTVETPGGVSDPPLDFEYTEGGSGQPVTTSIDPDSGPETGGTEVCISGENFVPGETIVHIGTETVPANEVEVNVDGTMACFVTPPHEPGVVDVTVETPGGVSEPPLDFEYTEGGPGQPVATDIEPDSGPETGGTTVVIVGDNFVPNQTSVHIGGNTVPPEQVLVFNATTLSFVTPPHAPGTVDVTVETADGESDPPLAFEYLDEGGVDERVPTALEVDFSEVISDANEVFEPGERVEVAPEWLNDSDDPQDLTGTAANFTGPAGPTYTLVDEDASYGMVAPGASASCQDAADCYEVEAGPEGVERPAQHWDTTFDETLSESTEHTWTLHLGDSFADTPRSHLFYRFIETIFHHGITVGCTSVDYCPNGASTRGQMAAFVLRGSDGSDFTPPPCDPGDPRTFDDVPASNVFCPWIEELARRGVVAGCDGSNYCPADTVTRQEMSVFLLRALLGEGYTPPTCTGVFADVPCPSPFADWIEDLSVRGITSGCEVPDSYCPQAPNTRGEMAVFLTRTFSLVLYRP